MVKEYMEVGISSWKMHSLDQCRLLALIGLPLVSSESIHSFVVSMPMNCLSTDDVFAVVLKATRI